MEMAAPALEVDVAKVVLMYEVEDGAAVVLITDPVRASSVLTVAVLEPSRPILV